MNSLPPTKKLDLNLKKNPINLEIQNPNEQFAPN
jgi:hypothetical protein